MANEACELGGCAEDIRELQKQMERLINPETGAIKQLREVVDSRTAWEGRIRQLEAQMEHLTNPETGTVGKFREQLADKVSWLSAMWIIGVFLTIIGTAFWWTNQATANLRIEMKEGNAIQDKNISDIKDDMKEIKSLAQEAKDSINSHRAFSEGRNYKKNNIRD